jgi:hypothetical protein
MVEMLWDVAIVYGAGWISTFGFGRSVLIVSGVAKTIKNPSMKGAAIYFWSLVYSKQNPHLLSKPISPGFITPKLSTCRWD